MDTIGTKIDSVLADAFDRYQADQAFADYWDVFPFLTLEDCSVYSWPQLWVDTSCGFGGPAGQAFTTAQTVVIEIGLINLFMVYHDWRYAYQVCRPSEEFWKRFHAHDLPGAASTAAVERLRREG